MERGSDDVSVGGVVSGDAPEKDAPEKYAPQKVMSLVAQNDPVAVLPPPAYLSPEISDREEVGRRLSLTVCEHVDVGAAATTSLRPQLRALAKLVQVLNKFNQDSLSFSSPAL